MASRRSVILPLAICGGPRTGLGRYRPSVTLAADRDTSGTPGGRFWVKPHSFTTCARIPLCFYVVLVSQAARLVCGLTDHLRLSAGSLTAAALTTTASTEHRRLRTSRGHSLPAQCQCSVFQWFQLMSITGSSDRSYALLLATLTYDHMRRSWLPVAL